jgi:tRNA G18 (ribose-2'-O)-methylase SpoU
MTPPAEGVIVLGNESTGVSAEILQKIKKVISIPGDRSLGAESLNVAAAASIIAAWWVKGQGA